MERRGRAAGCARRVHVSNTSPRRSISFRPYITQRRPRSVPSLARPLPTSFATSGTFLIEDDAYGLTGANRRQPIANLIPERTVPSRSAYRSASRQRFRPVLSACTGRRTSEQTMRSNLQATMQMPPLADGGARSRTGFDPELPIRLSRPYATKPLAASNWLPKS